MEIVATVLRTAAKGSTKTRIMYDAYLSHSQVGEYLNYLLGSGMLLYDGEEGLYRITDKALRFLNAAHQLNTLLPFQKGWNDEDLR